MSLAVFNINDAGIQVSVDGELLRTSPGYAVLDSGNLLTGEQASANAKLLPRWTNNRFWSQLDVNPLPNATGQIRHHADLAFAHLESLWTPLKKEAEAAVLVVPGYYGTDKLGLLLGMANECGLPVKSIIDNSIIQASDLPLRRLVLHLDIHLHAITLSVLQNSGTLVRREVKTVIESGYFTLMERWASVIAEQFIQASRFDPLHNADTEQQLFNQLPGWVARLGQSNTHEFLLPVANTEHRVSVSNESLLKACAAVYPQIVQAIRNEVPSTEQASVLLSHRFSGFPGLRDSLGLIKNTDVIDLTELKAIGSTTARRQEIIGSGNQIQHVVQLRANEADAPVTSSAQHAGSHLLWRHQARPVGRGLKLDGDLSAGPRIGTDPVCTIYPRNDELIAQWHKPSLIMLNGAAINESDDTTRLQPGDTLEIGGESLTIISVTTDG